MMKTVFRILLLVSFFAVVILPISCRSQEEKLVESASVKRLREFTKYGEYQYILYHTNQTWTLENKNFLSLLSNELLTNQSLIFSGNYLLEDNQIGIVDDSSTNYIYDYFLLDDTNLEFVLLWVKEDTNSKFYLPAINNYLYMQSKGWNALLKKEFGFDSKSPELEWDYPLDGEVFDTNVINLNGLVEDNLRIKGVYVSTNGENFVNSELHYALNDASVDEEYYKMDFTGEITELDQYEGIVYWTNNLLVLSETGNASIYVYAIDRFGNTSPTNKIDITVSKYIPKDFDPPTYELTVSPEIFTPDGDGNQDDVDIQFSLYDENEIQDWKVEIYQMNHDGSFGKKFRTFSGSEVPEDPLIWDGYNDKTAISREKVGALEKYAVVLSARDIFNNQLTNAYKTVETGVFLEPTEFGLKIRVSSIQFGSGSHIIEKSSYDSLNQIAEMLKLIIDDYSYYGLAEDFSITIIGHSDDVPIRRKQTIDKYVDNQGLSEERSKSVYQYFVTKGIDETKINFIGMGSAQPIREITETMKEDAEENEEIEQAIRDFRAMNRRVEFFIDKGTVEEEDLKAGESGTNESVLIDTNSQDRIETNQNIDGSETKEKTSNETETE